MLRTSPHSEGLKSECHKCTRQRRMLCTTVAAVRSSSLTQTIRRLEANPQTRQPVSANQPTSASKPTNQPASQPKDDQPAHQPAQNKQPVSLPHLLDIALSIDLLVKFFSRFEKVVEQNITMWDQSAHESESFEFCKHLATVCGLQIIQMASYLSKLFAY